MFHDYWEIPKIVKHLTLSRLCFLLLTAVRKHCPRFAGIITVFSETICLLKISETCLMYLTD